MGRIHSAPRPFCSSVVMTENLAGQRSILSAAFILRRLGERLGERRYRNEESGQFGSDDFHRSLLALPRIRDETLSERCRAELT